MHHSERAFRAHATGQQVRRWAGLTGSCCRGAGHDEGEKEGSKGLPGQNFSKGLFSLLPRHGVQRARDTCMEVGARRNRHRASAIAFAIRVASARCPELRTNNQIKTDIGPSACVLCSPRKSYSVDAIFRVTLCESQPSQSVNRLRLSRRTAVVALERVVTEAK